MLECTDWNCCGKAEVLFHAVILKNHVYQVAHFLGVIFRVFGALGTLMSFRTPESI